MADADSQQQRARPSEETHQNDEDGSGERQEGARQRAEGKGETRKATGQEEDCPINCQHRTQSSSLPWIQHSFTFPARETVISAS